LNLVFQKSIYVVYENQRDRLLGLPKGGEEDDEMATSQLATRQTVQPGENVISKTYREQSEAFQ
jgi:hypothetical protein